MASPQKRAKRPEVSVAAVVFKSFVIPIIALAFYIGALWQVNKNIQNAFLRGNENDLNLSRAEKSKNAEIISKFDFVKICVRTPPPKRAELRASLEQSGLAGQIRHLYWGALASCALIGILAISFPVVALLNRLARRSRNDLIRCTRAAWKLVSVAALLQVILLTPLITYGAFEFTVLLAERYYPQLLLVLAVAGLATIGACWKILLSKIPLKAVEPMSREVLPDDAPELWAAVREAAARLQTAPPDHIIIGMQLNFFVSEFEVQHDNGVVHGKTLFLSYPLLRQLSEEEIIAIIGHELGHFIGEDTELTRHFYPLWRKAAATSQQVGANPLIAWTSFQFLSFFALTFAKTENAYSREREILADQKAAELTSPATAARALVKFHAMVEGIHRGITAVVRSGDANAATFETALGHKLPDDPEFWTGLFEESVPHPMDSHPALRARLGSLGQELTQEQAQAITCEEVPNAFGKWFQGRETLFTAILEKTESIVKEMREKAKISDADYKTETGRELLDRHFPERKWSRKSARPWFAVSICGLLSAGALTAFILGFYSGLDNGFLITFSALVLVFAFCGRVAWVRHSHGEITLNAAGVAYTGWIRSLTFSDVKSISAQTYNGSTTLFFHLKEKADPIWKISFPAQSKSVGINIMSFNEKPMELANVIYRYFTRQSPEHAKPKPEVTAKRFAATVLSNSLTFLEKAQR